MARDVDFDERAIAALEPQVATAFIRMSTDILCSAGSFVSCNRGDGGRLLCLHSKVGGKMVKTKRSSGSTIPARLPPEGRLLPVYLSTSL